MLVRSGGEHVDPQRRLPVEFEGVSAPHRRGRRRRRGRRPAPRPGRGHAGRGSPSRSGNTVRRVSWRAATSRPRRSARPGPAGRAAATPSGCCRSGSALRPGTGTTVVAGRRRAAPGRAFPGRQRGTGRAGQPAAAAAATVGVSNIARRQVHAQLGAHAAGQPHDQQRMAAQGEEVVVDRRPREGSEPRRTGRQSRCSRVFRATRPSDTKPNRATRPHRACPPPSAATHRPRRTRPEPCNQAAGAAPPRHRPDHPTT